VIFVDANARSSDLSFVGRISNPSVELDGLEIRPTNGPALSQVGHAALPFPLPDQHPYLAPRIIAAGWPPPDAGGRAGPRPRPVSRLLRLALAAWRLANRPGRAAGVADQSRLARRLFAAPARLAR